MIKLLSFYCAEDRRKTELSSVCKEKEELGRKDQEVGLTSDLIKLEEGFGEQNWEAQTDTEMVQKLHPSFDSLDEIVLRNICFSHDDNHATTASEYDNDAKDSLNFDSNQSSAISLIGEEAINNTNWSINYDSNQSNAMSSIRNQEIPIDNVSLQTENASETRAMPDGTSNEKVDSPVHLVREINDNDEDGDGSKRRSSYCLETEDLTKRIDVLSNEKDALRNEIKMIRESNESLTKGILELKRVNEQIKETSLENLKELHKNSDLAGNCRCLDGFQDNLERRKSNNDLLNGKTLAEYAAECKKIRSDLTKAMDSKNEIIDLLSKKSLERDSIEEKCSQLQQQQQDVQMSIEYLAEEVTGFSMKGTNSIKIIDCVISCYLEEKDHSSRLESEVNALKGGGGPVCGSETVESLRGEIEEIREYCIRLESKQSKEKLVQQVDTLKSERTKLEKKLNETHQMYEVQEKMAEELARINRLMHEENKMLLQDVESMKVAKEDGLQKISDLENLLEKGSIEELEKSRQEMACAEIWNSSVTKVNSHDLQKKLSNLASVCAGLKNNLETVRTDLSEWDEIGRLIGMNLTGGNAKESCKTDQESHCIDKKELKNMVLRVFDDYQRLKCTDNLVKQQMNENYGLRKRLDIMIAKNNDMQIHFSRFALKERQLVEAKAKLSKMSNERHTAKRSMEQLKEKLREYENDCSMSGDLVRENKQLHAYNESVSSENVELKSSVEEQRAMLHLLQDENEMLQQERMRLEELKATESQRNEDLQQFENELAEFEKILSCTKDDKLVLEEAVAEVKERLELKEFELLEVREVNSELEAKLSEMTVKQEELDKVRSENDLSQSISVEQREIISSLRFQKAQMATEIDDLRSKLGGTDNARPETENLSDELDCFKMKFDQMEIQYEQTKEVADTLVDRCEATENKLWEATNIIAVLSEEKSQIQSDCEKISKDIERLQKLLAESESEKVAFEEDIRTLRKEIDEMRTLPPNKHGESTDEFSRRLVETNADVENYYMSSYVDKQIDPICDEFGKDAASIKSQVRKLREELIEKEAINAMQQLENTQLKIDYETLLEQKGMAIDPKKEYRATRMEEEAFQERLDALMDSNAQLIQEKTELESYLEDLVTESKSLHVEIEKVCAFISRLLLTRYLSQNWNVLLFLPFPNATTCPLSNL